MTGNQIQTSVIVLENDIKNIEKIKIKFFIAAKIFINDIILK